MSRTIPQWVKDSKYHFCAACGTTEDLQYNHLVPKSLGGKDEPSNIIVLCAECHRKWHQQGGSEHHNYLVREGVRRAQERGAHVGKPNADYEKVMRLISEKSTQFNAGSLTTEHEIMEEAGVKSVCYAKCKRMLFDAIGQEEWPYEWPKPVQVMNRPLYDRVIKRMRGDSV